MYMLFTVAGSLFIILFGLGIAYELLWLDDEEPDQLEGHPINSTLYNLTGHIVPVVCFDYFFSSSSFRRMILTKMFPNVSLERSE